MLIIIMWDWSGASMHVVIELYVVPTSFCNQFDDRVELSSETIIFITKKHFKYQKSGKKLLQ